MPRRAVISALVALALLWAAPLFAASSQVLATGRYSRVQGDPEARAVAQEVAALIDDAVPKAARITGATDLRPVEAVVFRDRRRFSAATGVPPDNPLVGLAVFPEEVIYVDGSEVYASLHRVVPHEVGHVITYRALDRRAAALPRWFSEGLAEYIASPEPAYVDPVALAALRQGGAIPLSKLEEAFQDPQSVGEAYAEASSVVSFLVRRDGEQVVARLLAALRETHGFPAALRQTTGLSLDQLETEWQRWLRRWWFALPDLDLILWFVMVVLLLIAVVRALRERRRRREEAEADILDGT